MNIVFFDIKGREEKAFFKSKLKGHKLSFFEDSIHNVSVQNFKNADIVVVFIHSNVTSHIIEKLPNLKVILTQSTGFDHIDLKCAHVHNVKVGNVPFYGENTVAEHTFALILNLSRKIHKSYIRTLNNDFSIGGLTGFDLKGKNLGIIGVGHIGMNVIKIAKGFGMHVKAYDLHPDKFMSEVLHFNYADIDEILKTSDIISLHMPLNEKTFHFLDEKKMKLLKKNALIINTARGGLIDTKALYKYLKAGKIGGAGLDVIEGEEMISHEDELLNNPSMHGKLSEYIMDKKIFEMENVIFTPHNAFNSKEAIMRIYETTYENLVEFLDKKEVKFSV